MVLNFTSNCENVTSLMVFYDSTWFYASLINFTDFRVLTLILHVLYILTPKIKRFYKSKCIFNNYDNDNWGNSEGLRRKI
jgi:hypothetical protein